MGVEGNCELGATMTNPKMFDMQTILEVFWAHIEDHLYIGSADELWNNFKEDLVRVQRRADSDASSIDEAVERLRKLDAASAAYRRIT